MDIIDKEMEKKSKGKKKGAKSVPMLKDGTKAGAKAGAKAAAKAGAQAKAKAMVKRPAGLALEGSAPAAPSTPKARSPAASPMRQSKTQTYGEGYPEF